MNNLKSSRNSTTSNSLESSDYENARGYSSSRVESGTIMPKRESGYTSNRGTIQLSTPSSRKRQEVRKLNNRLRKLA